MKMKDVIARTGIPERTVRFYEEKGLIQVPTERRNGRTYHEFTEENVRELKQILTLRKARFSLEEIETMQQDPEKIRDIVETNTRRLQQEKESLERLTLNEGLKEADSWGELSVRVDQSLRAIPDYETKLRFGQFDEESDEQRQTAIAAYQKKVKRQNWIQPAVITVLGILCLILGLSTFFLIQEKNSIVPAPSGTTDGWVYYTYGNDLMRSLPDGTGAELIYQHKNSQCDMQFIVDEEKIYLLDGMELYSVNADGTGEYRYEPELATSFTNAGEDLSVFLLYEGNIYVGQHQAASFGTGKSCLSRVPVDGSEQSRIKVDESAWIYTAGQIWDGDLYLFGSYTDQYEDEGEMVVPVAVAYDLETDKILEEYEGPAETCSWFSLYFGENEGYLAAHNTYSTNAVEEGYRVLRVTPDNIQGEAIEETFGGKWLYDMYEEYALYSAGNSIVINASTLENLKTGETMEFKANNSDQTAVEYQFMPDGLMLIYDRETWELVAYP